MFHWAKVETFTLLPEYHHGVIVGRCHSFRAAAAQFCTIGVVETVLQRQNQLCRNKTTSHFCSENLHRCKKSRRLRVWTPPAVTTNSLPVLQSSLSSGAEWKSRWSSWAPRSYLIVSMDVKQYGIKQSSVKCRGNIVAGRLIMPPPVFNCDLSLLISSCSAVMIKAC